MFNNIYLLSHFTVSIEGSYYLSQGFVKLHVFTVLVPCCDVHYDLRLKTMSCSSLVPFDWSEVKILLMLFVFIYVYTVIQHDFHIR